MPAKNFKVEFMRRTFNFSLLLVKFISIVSPTATTKVIIDQVLRSGLSIGANVTEAQGSSSKNEFKNFIHHAYKSSLETRYWLTILKEIITDKEKSQVEPLINEVKEISKILGSILLTLKGKKIIHS
ncbi:hypothetical protein A3F03_02610 [Candidatus Roizmanbacteria bacterium RIFCSPHIGHO2_12_FULL_41_11]|uniref:Four helix bundle protein n=3 Tax=Candidatus Roizmaniibacteriota TaxID=1752723 RepID=A0A1F7JRR4_9BACT|nr:MAG: hypothetical protein A3F03_02610 [Candidatus Roizmanbacteria bacterium RIFCSPHIGHO2_12_FULL_41_11]OGK52498.1 MAG: hypothetical protein A2966_02350 [Candidatus Roizmanbacteria bacterium RIFCSPLOWO2_01_FULL_41_22]OGK58319.1 MAG: hypothetical protein A3H86_03090 [Candidatus Roizmanbacteria bacterium RIFCSPLOWO2_02_FULL_41_9]